MCNNAVTKYKKMTLSQENALKNLVKNKLFRQYKYIDGKRWETGQIQVMIMTQIGLVGGNAAVEELWKCDVQKKVCYNLSQYHHSQINALCSIFVKGK